MPPKLISHNHRPKLSPPRLSRPDHRAQNSGAVLYLHPGETVDFKVWFADRFSAWLQAQFDTPEQIAVAFGVRNSTAWNWWNGDNRASGDAVMRLAMHQPEVIAWFQDQWQHRRAA